MRIRKLHDWNLSPCEAMRLQDRLRRQLITSPIRPRPTLVAGVDASYTRGGDRIFAGVVVLRLPDLETVEEVSAVRPIEYPYVPGLLSFREAPAVLDAFRKLRVRPDAVIFDGHGRSHMRGMGLAAHVGLWLDLPTVGCAKSRLVGDAGEPGPEPGDRAPLRYNGRIVGSVLRTRRNVKPVFVSSGHRAYLPDAVGLVLRCCIGCRLPETTRRAHALVNRERLVLHPHARPEVALVHVP